MEQEHLPVSTGICSGSCPSPGEEVTNERNHDDPEQTHLATLARAAPDAKPPTASRGGPLVDDVDVPADLFDDREPSGLKLGCPLTETVPVTQSSKLPLKAGALLAWIGHGKQHWGPSGPGQLGPRTYRPSKC